MKYRNIEKTDIPLVIKLIKKCAPQLVPHHEYTYWVLSRYFGSTCFVCEKDKEIIGFVSSMGSVDESGLFIWQICVDPNYRRKNIANNLLLKVFKSLSKLGLNNLQLSIEDYNSPSKNLFTHFAKTNNLTIKKIGEDELGGSTETIYQISV